MKKTIICAVCILCLCGGLFCVHLVAQPEKPAPVSLLDPKISDQSERELLELKVVSHRKLVDNIAAYAQAGDPRGRASQLTEVHAGLYTAEIELYRHTGERDKLLAAMQSKVDVLREKLRAVMVGYELNTVPLDVVGTTEIQLLDALLEQKRVRAATNTQ